MCESMINRVYMISVMNYFSISIYRYLVWLFMLLNCIFIKIKTDL